MREPTRSQGKSVTLIVLAVVGASCGLCSLLTLGLIGFGLFTTDSTTSAPVTVSVPVAVTTKLPTGNTPDLFPGMPGWLPSGHGVPIPAAEEVDGEPRGLWWNSELRGNTTAAAMTVFIEGGTYATNPRLGGGTSFDLEGQRAQKGTTGLGTFEVADGKISQHHDGFNFKAPLSFDEDEGGPFMMMGSTKYWPLTPPTEAGLVGTWRTAGGKYIFRGDGTFESGQVDVNGAYTLAVGGQGRFVLDGYLMQVTPQGAPGWITLIGATGDHFLVIGSSLYDRE